MELTYAFLVLSAAIAAIVTVFKRAFKVQESPMLKRFTPLLSLIIGGICGPFVFETTMLFFAVLQGMLAGSVSSHAYDILKRTIKGE